MGSAGESLLSRLARGFLADGLALCASRGDRPDLILADRVCGLVVLDIESEESDPTSRAPFARLNRKVTDLREQYPIVASLRPHRLVVFEGCPDSLLPAAPETAPRTLGLADVYSGVWRTRLESRPISPKVLGALRAELSPALSFDLRYHQGTNDPGRAERASLRIELDARQAAAATLPSNEVLVLTGSPGSGKTLVLASRARHLATLHPDWRIAMLCYNNALVPHLQALVAEHPNIRVQTFAKYAHQSGHRFAFDTAYRADADFAAAQSKGITPEVDALLVDEFQDFHNGWIRFLLATVRKERGGTTLAGDDGQAIYREISPTTALVGRNVDYLALGHPYRSTRQILEAASALQPTNASSEGLEGQPVELIWAQSWSDQAEAAAWHIRHMIESDERQPGDIAILVTQRRGTLKRLLTALSAAGIPHQIEGKPEAANPTADVRRSSVRIMTVHAAKGLEFDVVILFGLEALPYRGSRPRSPRPCRLRRRDKGSRSTPGDLHPSEWTC
ncbi:hypothetical protein GCM10027589_03620 [Actinocorallia lasiicapitis]